MGDIHDILVRGAVRVATRRSDASPDAPVLAATLIYRNGTVVHFIRADRVTDAPTLDAHRAHVRARLGQMDLRMGRIAALMRWGPAGVAVSVGVFFGLADLRVAEFYRNGAQHLVFTTLLTAASYATAAGLRWLARRWIRKNLRMVG